MSFRYDVSKLPEKKIFSYIGVWMLFFKILLFIFSFLGLFCFLLLYFFWLFRRWLSEAQPGHLRPLWGHDGSKSFMEKKKREFANFATRGLRAVNDKHMGFLNPLFSQKSGHMLGELDGCHPVYSVPFFCVYLCVCVCVCVCVFCRRGIVPYFLN